MIRLALAFIFAPIMPALPFFLLPLWMLISTPTLEHLHMFLGIWAFIGIVAYPVALGAGVPLYMWLRKNPRFQHCRFYLLAGSVLGLIEFVIFQLLSSPSTRTESNGELAFIACFFVLAGCASALVFWLMTMPIRNKHLNVQTSGNNF